MTGEVYTVWFVGHVMAQLINSLHYKPEGRRYDYRWGLPAERKVGGGAVGPAPASYCSNLTLINAKQSYFFLANGDQVGDAI